jgi:hypothetical protein
MRHLFVLAALVAACAPAPPAPAAPAVITPGEPSAWISADGVISVTIPAGWSNAEDPSADEQRLLTIASPTQIQSQQALRQCSVEGLAGGPQITQDALNAASEGATAESLLGPPGEQNDVHTFSNEIVNGVRVVSFYRNMGDFRHLQTVFALAGARGATRYTVACGLGGGENADIDVAAAQQFMSSLSINVRTSP